MRVATWNVNSIRTRLGRVLDWIDAHEPDVLALQETKCSDAQWTAQWTSEQGVSMCDDAADPFAARGYEVAHHGVDHRNGVAIVSRVGLDDVRRGFAGPSSPPYDEPRLITATCGGIRIQSVYVPNGRELDDPHYLYKLVWLERLRAELAVPLDAGHPTLSLGDFNVAPADADIYDPKRWRRRTHASPPERAAIAALLELGLCDVTRAHLPDDGVFTWWGYRPGQFDLNRGLRIDLALADERLAEQVERVWIDRDERAGERPSDHAPLVVDLRAPTRSRGGV
ncbi:MAG: exodeoxyribonuclease III [Acidimicrobiales bacterium]